MNGDDDELGEPILAERGGTSLLDAVDRLVDRGAVLSGGIRLSIGGVDLILLELRLLLSSFATLEKRRNCGTASAVPPAGADSPGVLGGGYEYESVRPGESEPTLNVDPGVLETELSSGGDGELGPASLDVFNEPQLGAAVVPSPDASSDASHGRIALDPQHAEQGLARLVLTLIEFIRQLLERQAIRRMDGGLLTDAELERMGEALARLEEKVEEMANTFGLQMEDLDLDLGPLGTLNRPSGKGRHS